MESAPSFALAVPRPWCWLLSHGVLRDWTVSADPGPLVGQWVWIYSSEAGDSEGYRRLAHLLRDTAYQGATVAQVRAECPRSAVVGLARLELATPLEGRWRLHLAQAHPVGPLVPAIEASAELLALPPLRRPALEDGPALRTGSGQ